MSKFSLVIGNKNYSSWSLRAWLALKQTNCGFEEIVIPLDTPTTRRAILRYSPSGRVPVLIHDNQTIWESMAIAEYVAEQFPEANLWPQESRARACARAVSAEMHAGFSLLRQYMPMDCRSSHPTRGREPGVDADIERVTEIWRSCRQEYGGNGEFLFGEFTITDAMYAPVVTRFNTYAVKLDPISRTYADAIVNHPPMQEWLAAAAQEPWFIEDP